VIAPLALADSGVWGERGIGRRYAVRSPLLFEADGRGVSVYDISDNTPRQLGSIATRAESLDLAVSDDLYVVTRDEIARFGYAANGALTLRASLPTGDYDSIAAGDGYIATAGPSRLTIWSTSEELPVIAAEIAAPGAVTAIAFQGSRLWVAIRDQAIYGYDLGTQTGSIPVNAKGLAIKGDMLYAAAGTSGLVVADISDAATPRIVSRVGAGEVNLGAIALGTDRVFASEGTDAIRVYDAATFEEKGIIHDHAQRLAADGKRLFAGGADVDEFGLIHLTPIRFAVYEDGARAGTFNETLAGPVSGAATDGTFAYVIDWPYFRVLDISTPSRSNEIASIAFPAMQDFVKIQNGLAIVYGRGKLNLVDVHDPWRPRFLGTYDSLGMPGGGATFAGDNIIEANPETGLHVLDFFKFTTPDKPVQIGGVIWHYFELASLYPAVYAFDFGLIRVIDVTDPHVVRTVREVPMPRGPAVVAGNYLVVESADRFHVLDVSDRFNPIEVGGAALPPTPGVVAADGDGVLVAHAGAVDRLDISNPVHPQMTKTAMTARAPMQIHAAGGKVVIADRYALRVYGEATAAPQQPPARMRPTRR